MKRTSRRALLAGITTVSLAGCLSVGEDWRTFDPADRDYPDCYGVTVKIDRNGRLSIAVSTDEYECSEDALEPGRRANESVTRG